MYDLANAKFQMAGGKITHEMHSERIDDILDV